MDKRELMRMAIELSKSNIENGGGPFGAVIARDGEVIATGANSVVPACDPTAHAEVVAIRAAAAKLGTHDLSGCEIYSSCEPCPMCLAAIYWAHIDRLYYGNSKGDAKDVDFDDSFIYDELELSPDKRHLQSSVMMADEAIEAFDIWREKLDKVRY